MKKSLFLAALVLMSAGCFAQKANVKKAKNLAMQETPDFEGARAAINPALTDAETAELAETWYVAGLIGYQQCQKAALDQMMGQPVDQAVIGDGVLESYQYWLKADEIACRQLIDKKGNPMVDKKGNPVIDTKTRSNIAKKMQEYYEKQELVKYGIYLNDQRDFKTAYEVFKAHLEIPTLSMMDEKAKAKMPTNDSTYLQYKYYEAIFAIQAEMHPEAIAVLNEMKDGDYETISVNQFLYQEYVNLNDTANFVATLQNAVVRFPQEAWFLQNLINYYIFSGQEAVAIEYLAKAIEREPNVAQYHHIKGNLDENQKNYEAALEDFDRALALDPKMADAMAGKGRVYYNQAVKINEDAAYISDNKEYKKALDEMQAMFRKSLPFFEEAHKMEPDNRDYMIVLRQLYGRFGMDKEREAINEEMNK